MPPPMQLASTKTDLIASYQLYPISISTRLTQPKQWSSLPESIQLLRQVDLHNKTNCAALINTTDVIASSKHNLPVCVEQHNQMVSSIASSQTAFAVLVLEVQVQLVVLMQAVKSVVCVDTVWLVEQSSLLGQTRQRNRLYGCVYHIS